MHIPLASITQPALRTRLESAAKAGEVPLSKLVAMVGDVLRAHFIQETERTWQTTAGVLRHDYDPRTLEETLIREAGLTAEWSSEVVKALQSHSPGEFNPYRFYFNQTERGACLTQWWPAEVPSSEPEAIAYFMRHTMERIETHCPAALARLSVGTELWRGRVDDGTLWDQVRTSDFDALGPPPADRACANRANETGVRCFYGAEDVQTMLSELRTHSGWTVYAGHFRVEREIPILDFGALAEATLPSPFESEYKDRVRDAGFFRNLAWNFSQAYGPHMKDEVHASTRSFVDHCRREYASRIHGVRFESSQRPQGHNVALFADDWGDPSPLRLQSTFTLVVRSRHTSYEGVDVLLPQVRPMPS